MFAVKILTVCVAGFGILHAEDERRLLLNDPEVLQTQLHAVQNAVQELTTKYNDVLTKYSDVSTKNNDLMIKYNDLTTKYNDVSSKNNDLTIKYNDMSTKYSDLSTKYNDLLAKNTNGSYFHILKQFDMIDYRYQTDKFHYYFQYDAVCEFGHIYKSAEYYVIHTE
jgi:predicted nuclease with TOPRIM domain